MMSKKKVFASLILSAACVLSLTGCLSSIFSSQLYPYKSANKIEVPKKAYAPYQDAYLDTQSGNKINLWYYKTSANRPLVIYFHGNGHNIGGALEAGLFEKFVKRDYNFLMWDFPAYGNSTGKPSEKSLTEGALAVMDYVKNTFSDAPVVIWGRSLGAAIAIKTAYLRQDQASALILTSPWDYGYSLAMTLAGFSEKWAKIAAKKNQYPSAEFAQSIHIPSLVFHGDKDELVLFSLGQNLVNNFPEGVVSFIIKEGKDHNNLQDAEYWEDFFLFVDQFAVKK